MTIYIALAEWAPKWVALLFFQLLWFEKNQVLALWNEIFSWWVFWNTWKSLSFCLSLSPKCGLKKQAWASAGECNQAVTSVFNRISRQRERTRILALRGSINRCLLALRPLVAAEVYCACVWTLTVGMCPVPAVAVPVRTMRWRARAGACGRWCSSTNASGTDERTPWKHCPRSKTSANTSTSAVCVELTLF